MDFIISIIQTILVIHVIFIVILIQKYNDYIKLEFIKYYSGLKNMQYALYIVYSLISIVFISSALEIIYNTPIPLLYKAQRNFYICFIVFLLAYLINNLANIIPDNIKTDKTNEYNMKQHTHSMEFINKVIADLKNEREKNALLTTTMLEQAEKLKVERIKAEEKYLKETRKRK